MSQVPEYSAPGILPKTAEQGSQRGGWKDPRGDLGSMRTDRAPRLNWTGHWARQEARLLLPDGVFQVPLPKEPKKHGLEVTPVQCAQAGVKAQLRVDILADHQHGVPACLAGPSKGHIAQEEGWQVVRCGFPCTPQKCPQPRPLTEEEGGMTHPQ